MTHGVKAIDTADIFSLLRVAHVVSSIITQDERLIKRVDWRHARIGTLKIHVTPTSLRHGTP